MGYPKQPIGQRKSKQKLQSPFDPWSRALSSIKHRDPRRKSTPQPSMIAPANASWSQRPVVASEGSHLFGGCIDDSGVSSVILALLADSWSLKQRVGGKGVSRIPFRVIAACFKQNDVPTLLLNLVCKVLKHLKQS